MDNGNHSRQGDASYHESINDSEPGTLIQETVNNFNAPQQMTFAARRHDEPERHGDWWPSSSGPQLRTVSSSSTSSYHTAYSRRSASPELQSGYERNQETALPEMQTNSCKYRINQTSVSWLPFNSQYQDNVHGVVFVTPTNALPSFSVI